jgi:uncharacterized protein (DUF488 family)
MPRDDTFAPDAPPTVYTIGHSNHPLDAFLALLERHGIRTLVDVRSQPYSRYVTHFNRPDLEAAIERRGLRYVYFGDELGGRPPGDEFYDAEGHVLYGRTAQAPFYRRGLDRLIEEGSLYKTAIMCSEEDPTDCHRRLLIARTLADAGVEVVHIRADGRLQHVDDFLHEQQMSLWGAAASESGEDEDAEWKSIRPVSRRRPQSSSSNPSDEWESDGF